MEANPPTTVSAPKPKPPGPPPDPWRQAVRTTAVVSGSFCVALALLLAANFIQGRFFDPLTSPELASLKVELNKNPLDEKLKERIRLVDLELRKKVFQRQNLANDGAWLLFGGMAVFLLTLKTVTYRKKIPRPPARKAPDSPTAHAVRASWAVAATCLLVVASAYTVATRSGTSLRASAAENAPLPATNELASANPVETASPASHPEPAKTSVPLPAAPFPTREEIRKNWPRFRGPEGAGISAFTNYPASWNGASGEGLLWKVAVPMYNPNSPVAWGDRLFLTGANAKKREVYCFEGGTGKLSWSKPVETPQSNVGEPPNVMEDSGGHAPSTAATDGRRVYAIFVNGDVAAFDLDGNAAWAVNLGKPDNSYGHAASLETYQDRLIVQYDQGSGKDNKSKIIALDAKTGKTVWQSPPRPVPNSWSTPISIEVSGKAQLITTGNPWVIAYQPADGTELWRAKVLYGEITPSAIAAAGLVFTANEGEKLSAIKPDGTGDVTATHVKWTGEEGLPDICSPLSDGKQVYLLSSSGVLTCYRIEDGKMLYSKELEEGFKASPSLVGDRIWLFCEKGKVILAQAGPEYKEVGCCTMGEEEIMASPAFVDGRVYVRGKKQLYCIGSKGLAPLAQAPVAASSETKPSASAFPTREEIRKNWPRFRGSEGAGISAFTNYPPSWNGTNGQGILWKTAAPTANPNSPIAWGDRLFLTGANAKKREVYCFAGATGKLLWQKPVETPQSNVGEPPNVMEDSGGHAPSTAATDGRRVYAIFVNGDVAAFDMDGNAVWAVNLGKPDNSYGHAASLETYQDRLIIQYDQGSGKDNKSKIIALDAKTGKTVWQSQPRPVPNSWSTPIAIEVGGKPQLITTGNPWVIAYQPADGTELWRAKVLYGEITPSAITSAGLVFTANEGEKLSAIKPDGTGDVTATHIKWTGEEGLPDICSPLSDGKQVYLLSSSGVLTSYRIEDGKMLYSKELEEGFKASPSLVGDRIWLFCEKGKVILAQAGPEYKEVGRCTMGEEEIMASPAFADGRVYVRGKKQLYCIGLKTP